MEFFWVCDECNANNNYLETKNCELCDTPISSQSEKECIYKCADSICHNAFSVDDASDIIAIVGRFSEKLEELYEHNEGLNAQNSELLKQNSVLSLQVNSLKEANKQSTAEFVEIKARLTKELAVIQSRLKTRTRMFLFALFLLMGGLAFYCYQMISYKDKYEFEYYKLRNVESELQKAQETLDAKELALSKEEQKTEELQNEFAGMCRAVFGSASDNFYAEEGVLLLQVGETATVRIHNVYQLEIKMELSDNLDKDAITIQQKSRDADLSDMEITANKSGYYMLVCQSGNRIENGKRFRITEAFNILVIVRDE